MTAKDVGARIKSALGSLLGTYTDPEGGTHSALNVGPKIPPGFKVTGVECVINYTPQLLPLREFGLGAKIGVERRWEVKFKQWEDGGTLEPVLAAVLKEFPDTPTPTIIGPTNEIVAQATFYIPDREDV